MYLDVLDKQCKERKYVCLDTRECQEDTWITKDGATCRATSFISKGTESSISGTKACGFESMHFSSILILDPGTKSSDFGTSRAASLDPDACDE